MIYNNFNNRYKKTLKILFLFGLTVLFIFELIIISENPAYADDVEFCSEKADFTIKFRDEISSYKVMGIYVLPGEKLDIEIIDKNNTDHFLFHPFDSSVVQKKTFKWIWTAPKRTG